MEYDALQNKQLELYGHPSILWYRQISPNTPVENIDATEHASSVCDSMFHLIGIEDTNIPADFKDKLRLLSDYTIEVDSTSDKVLANCKLPGVVKPIDTLDMMLEFAKRSDTVNIPKQARANLMALVELSASKIRNDTYIDGQLRLEANATLYNAKFSLLELRHESGKVDNLDGEYINLVKAQAKWLAENSQGKACGSLFESYITCLARYQAWMAENNDTVSVMHASTRQDKPARREDGGRGHAFAHDTHITGGGSVAMLQSKWGAGAHEARGYDISVTRIVETGEEVLRNPQDFSEAFEAIWRYDRVEKNGESRNAKFCDQMISKYGIDGVIQDLAEITRRQMGESAISDSEASEQNVLAGV